MSVVDEVGAEWVWIRPSVGLDEGGTVIERSKGCTGSPQGEKVVVFGAGRKKRRRDPHQGVVVLIDGPTNEIPQGYFRECLQG